MASVCTACGAESPAGARFCPACGAAQWTSCPTCGAEQTRAAAFCSECGAALRAGTRRAADVSDHEERRVVTVLFADLAGSTALGESLDPEDVRAVQGELFELVDREVERHGGVSEKFAGDAVLAVFGAPRAHEDDAERAVRAALAVREAFPRFAERVAVRHGAAVGLRIGVNTGEVVAGREAASRGEVMVSGDAVNVAARLQQLAPTGAVLVGERTRTATRRAIRYGRRYALDAKGKSAPVPGWEALAAVSEPGRAPAYSAPLIGRDEELELLRLTAARVVRDRTPQLVTVFGPAGVGKSRLVEEFCSTLENARVVTGRCVPYGDGITYLPLAEAAGALAGVLADDRAETVLERVRGAVEATVTAERVERVTAALVWTLGLELPAREAGVALAEDMRRTLEDGWTTYLAALGRERLLVLVIDDIHWGSTPLLDLLEHVVTSLEDAAVLVLCPSRPELLDVRPSWGTGRLGTSSLVLSPLAAEESRSLLRALLEQDVLSDEIASAVLEPAEGNPFFVEEMLAMLVEQGALERRDGGWTRASGVETSVPDSIHGVIAARIDLLGAAEREALRRCSVMGRTFWPSAVGIDDDLVAELARRALVSERPETSFSGRREFMFKHALTHEVAYASLPRGERRELHVRVAEWIAEVVPDRQAETTELIAYHYEQALAYGERDPELVERAFAATLTAAESAVLRGAYSTAESLLARALDTASSPEAKERALLFTARVDVHRGRYELATKRLDEVLGSAERRGDATMRADALGWRARACWLGGRWREALASSEAAVATLEGLPESPALAWALARLSQIQMLRGMPAAGETAGRAIGVARRTGARGAEANARTNAFTARLGEGAALREELHEIIGLASGAGAHDEAVRAVVNYLWSAWLTTPLDELEDVVAEAVRDLGIGLRLEFLEEYLRLSLAALVYVPAGRWPEADEVLRSRHEDTSPSNRLLRHWVHLGLALRRGELAEVDEHLPGFRESALASEEPQRILPMVSVAAPRALLAGDEETVRQLADLVTGLDVMAVSSSAALPIVRVLGKIGDAERIERLQQALSSTAGPVADAVRAAGSGLTALLAGRAEEAASALVAAEGQLAAYGRRYDAACVALEVATAHAAAGDGNAATAAGARAAEVLEPLGCVNPW